MKRIVCMCLVSIYVCLSCHPPRKGLPARRPADITTGNTRPDTLLTPPPVEMNKTDTFLENLMLSRSLQFGEILKNRDTLRVQVIYTRIDRNRHNEPVFTPFYFNVNEGNYFYPASTVKMPVALLALQRLNELRVYGLNMHSTMITHNSRPGQTAVNNDPTTPDGRPNIAQYIKKIFLVSDNDAFNRLYEFLGPQYINRQLGKMGCRQPAVQHRLSVNLSEAENRFTNAISFFNEDGSVLYTQPMQENPDVYAKRTALVGNAYYRGDTLIPGPMDFSAKNRLSLPDLSHLLRAILFPASMPVQQRFNLKPEEHGFILKCMSQFPAESGSPEYNQADYPDAFSKFLLYGGEKGSKPKHIRIFNKSGDAYGFLTDVAYIADFENNIEFMLGATIYCNKDGILNDDRYDYDSIGLPFMNNLGKLIYDHELSRNRKVKPDLSGFKLMYDSVPSPGLLK